MASAPCAPPRPGARRALRSVLLLLQLTGSLAPTVFDSIQKDVAADDGPKVRSRASDPAPTHSTARGPAFAWQYSVQLLTGALRMPASTPSVVMTKKGGKKYRCHLPQPPSNESKPDAGAAPPAQPVDEFLGPLVGQCYLKPEGWWTYEVCLSRRIRQYHQEKQAMVKGADGKPTPTGPGQITQA